MQNSGKSSNFFSKLPGPVKVSAVFGVLAVVVLIAALFALDNSGGADHYEEATAKSTASIFDSNFWLAGVPESEDMELEGAFVGLLSAVNPRTGATYTESEAKKVQYLAKRFPDNELIPRPDISDRAEQLKQKAVAHRERSQRITEGTGDPEEIGQYYGRLQKLYGDQIELLEYASSSDEVPDSIQERVRKMLDASRKVQAQLADQKEQSLLVWERRQSQSDVEAAGNADGAGGSVDAGGSASDSPEASPAAPESESN